MVFLSLAALYEGHGSWRRSPRPISNFAPRVSSSLFEYLPEEYRSRCRKGWSKADGLMNVTCLITGVLDFRKITRLDNTLNNTLLVKLFVQARYFFPYFSTARLAASSNIPCCAATFAKIGLARLPSHSPTSTTPIERPTNPSLFLKLIPGVIVPQLYWDSAALIPQISLLLQVPVQALASKPLVFREIYSWNATSSFSKATVTLCQNAGVSSAVGSVSGGVTRGPYVSLAE